MSIHRAFQALFERASLRSRGSVGRDLHMVGDVRVRGRGTIVIGDRVRLDASRAPIELNAMSGARIVVEDDVCIEGGTSIESSGSVVLSRGCRIGAWTKILDNHFHPLGGDRAERPAPGTVRIGPGAIVGDRCVVLPGARLEAGSRLGHGVVIGRRVPAGVTLEGSPPRRAAGGASA